jgi:FixJ family two-component response regulator
MSADMHIAALATMLSGREQNIHVVAWTDLHLDAGTPVLPHSSGAPASPVTPIVFVVDNDVSVRDSLELLAGWAGWRVETFTSASGFLTRPRASVPSCLVLDVGLPDGNGLHLQQRLADRPETPIIFVTDCGDLRTAVCAMKAGAVEFLTKPFADGLLLAAMRDAMERSRATLVREGELETLRRCYASLTCRERDVMALVVCGRLNKQSAAELGISEITVKAHRGKMMRKMGARCVPELVNMAAKLFAKA